MEEKKKAVVGLDLNEYYAQLSYSFLDAPSPETVEVSQEGEKYNIATAICKRREVNQWYYGKEAIKKGVSGEGTLLENLVSLAVSKQEVNIEGKSYQVAELMGLFIRKVLGRLRLVLGDSKIEVLVITVSPWNTQIPAIFKAATAGLSGLAEHIYLQSHVESLFSYIVHQPKELWSYQVGVFDLTGEILKAYRIEMNHKTKPIVTFVSEEEVEAIVRKKRYYSISEADAALKRLDLDFLSYLETFLKGNIVTAVYLIGEGFDGEWYKESLRLLCKNRRVFGGNNLFGKGACFSALEKAAPTEISENYLHLGREKLKTNIGMKIMDKQEEIYYPLLDAGTNWYEAKAELEFMLGSGKTIPLIFTPLDSGIERVEEIKIPGFRSRPDKTIRLSLMLEMESEKNLCVRIADLGFGDFFPAGDDIWKFQIHV